MIDAGFPRPVVQIELVSRTGVVVWRLDLGWPEVKLALEYDGARDHTDPADVAHDLQRRAGIAAQYGWTAIPVTGAQVFGSSMALEHEVGDRLGIAPTIGSRLW